MEGLRVRDIMIHEVTTLKRNDKLTLADDIMQLGRIRHLPVLQAVKDASTRSRPPAAAPADAHARAIRHCTWRFPAAYHH